MADTAGLHDRRVMVIDDSNTIRRSAEIFLVQAGCQVSFAEDGYAALEKIVELRPELIFCDILMPRLDGYQTCALIKRHPLFRHIPVVLLSARDGVFDRARGRLVGAADHLTKPFSQDSLVQAALALLPPVAGVAA